jgi:acyl carrier protein
MTQDEALAMIRDALNTVVDGAGDDITMETDLVADEVVDSLDLMNFLFELEQMRGAKIEQIDESFDDYRIATLVGFLTQP